MGWTLFNGGVQQWRKRISTVQPCTRYPPQTFPHNLSIYLQDAARSNVGAGNTDLRAIEPAVIAKTMTVPLSEDHEYEAKNIEASGSDRICSTL